MGEPVSRDSTCWENSREPQTWTDARLKRNGQRIFLGVKDNGAECEGCSAGAEYDLASFRHTLVHTLSARNQPQLPKDCVVASPPAEAQKHAPIEDKKLKLKRLHTTGYTAG